MMDAGTDADLTYCSDGQTCPRREACVRWAQRPTDSERARARWGRFWRDRAAGVGVGCGEFVDGGLPPRLGIT